MLSDEQYTKKEILLCEINRKEGVEHFNKQKYVKALYSFTQALKHVNDDIRSIVWRSKCYSKLRRTRKAIDEVDMALNLDPLDKEAMLQKAKACDQSGNPEMALVYLHRGLKHYPKSQEFKDAIEVSKKHASKHGRRMKMTETGDLTYFTPAHRQKSTLEFKWKKKPREKHGPAPSANFRSRLFHPLAKLHKTPSVSLSESRASSIHSLLANSLHSLAYEDRLVEETTERDALGEMYEDKQYLEFLVGFEAHKNKKTPLGKGKVGEEEEAEKAHKNKKTPLGKGKVGEEAEKAHKNKKTPLGKGKVGEEAEKGIQFLQERTQFWDSLGPLPPPHPSRISKSIASRSRLSQYTSTDSIDTVGTYQSNSTYRSYASNTSRKSKPGQNYRSRYAFNKKKEKPKPPNPEKVKFKFQTYTRDDDVRREMTEIPEEDMNERQEKERERRKEDAKKRGEEVMAFLEKETEAIDTFYNKGQLEQCKKRADACIDILGRYTEEEVPSKFITLSTLYSCLGNCDMHSKQYVSALENHGHDLLIGEQYSMPSIQSRALGNLGRVYVLMGKYNRALDFYNRKAPLCKTQKETAWLFHEIGNCFLMMKIFEYALESGTKALKAASQTTDRRLQLQTNVLVAVSEVNLMKYKDAYQHFENALQIAKLIDDKKVQDAMTKALVDVNKKMVTQMKSQRTVRDVTMVESPATFQIASITPARTRTNSACTNVTVEG